MSEANDQRIPITRRGVLQLAAAWGVQFALPQESVRGKDVRGKERPKSFILLWMKGGASQLETWDPHPGTKNGGETRAIGTKIDGVKIASFYPRMAQQLDSLSVIRSLVSKEGDHERGTYYLKTGYRPDPTLKHPAIGAIAAHEHAALKTELGPLKIPPYISLGPEEFAGRGGYLGETWDAFKLYDPGNSLPNMRSWLAKEREERRLSNQEVLEKTFRAGREKQLAKTLHRETMSKALDMMHSDQIKAFDIEQESAATRLKYGESVFGRGCLAARRLVETGVPAVEVTLGGWDSHANNYEAHKENGNILDTAFAALLADLKERELFESTVVLCLGEFGRTPRINPLEGRDHWPSGFSCLIGGGGLRGGVVIGETDPESEKPEPKDPVTIADLSATVLKQLGIEWSRELITPIGRPLKLSEGNPLVRLLPEG